MTGMEHKPLTKAKSPWIEFAGGGQIIEGVAATWWKRNVSDGMLAACVSDEPVIGWHLSISFRTHKGDLSRYPRWDEIVHARQELLPDDIGFVMHLPPVDEYVALHDTTFHLHQHPAPLPEGLQ